MFFEAFLVSGFNCEIDTLNRGRARWSILMTSMAREQNVSFLDLRLYNNSLNSHFASCHSMKIYLPAQTFIWHLAFGVHQNSMCTSEALSLWLALTSKSCVWFSSCPDGIPSFIHSTQSMESPSTPTHSHLPPLLQWCDSALPSSSSSTVSIPKLFFLSKAPSY